MKRSQLKSPLGSPALQQTVRAKQKKGPGGEGTASGSGGKIAAQRKAAAKAWEASRRPPPPLPPVGVGVDVTPAEATILMARWDKDMDEMLREGVLRYGADWECVSSHMAPHVCSKEEVEKRWQMVKDAAVKGPWSPEEDALLKVLVEEYGSKKWSLIATQFPGRSGKQCRERWLNHLDTRVRKSAWTGGEDVVLCEAQGRLGNKWSEISKLLPGRAENAVKNRFNSIITKRLAQEGGLVKGGVFKKSSKGNKGKQQRPVKEEEGGDRDNTAPLIKRQVRKKRTPSGFDVMDAYETDWDSSEDEEGGNSDMAVYPEPALSPSPTFTSTLANFNGISLNSHQANSNKGGVAAPTGTAANGGGGGGAGAGTVSLSAGAGVRGSKQGVDHNSNNNNGNVIATTASKKPGSGITRGARDVGTAGGGGGDGHPQHGDRWR